MMFVRRAFFRILALSLVTVAVPAWAQDVFDRGKSAQQIFASDCALCHKSPQGLAKGGGGMFGLQGFLREHYTTSRETASLLARYLEAAGSPPAAQERRAPSRRTTRPSEAKPSEAKPSEAKPSEAKPSEAKPSEAKPSEAKPAEVKPAEVKPAEAKPAEPKPAESKPAESKPVEAKPEPAPAPKESSGTEIKSGIAVSPAPADKPAKTE